MGIPVIAAAARLVGSKGVREAAKKYGKKAVDKAKSTAKAVKNDPDVKEAFAMNRRIAKKGAASIKSATSKAKTKITQAKHQARNRKKYTAPVPKN